MISYPLPYPLYKPLQTLLVFSSRHNFPLTMLALSPTGELMIIKLCVPLTHYFTRIIVL